MKAIILAAGKGSRMGRLTKNTHKTLLKINGTSLLTKIVEDLRNLNIKDILIVTGYKSSLIKNHIKNKARYSYFSNYKNTNNLQSLLHVKNELNSSFICLFSDLFFDKKILSILKKDRKEICLAINTKEVLKNTMRVKIENQNIVDIGSDIDVSEGHGNFIGIAKFSKSGAQKLKKKLNLLKNNYEDYYTEALKKLIKSKNKIRFIDFKSIYWKEVDLNQDYINLKKKYESK